MAEQRLRGHVKWFSDAKGYGFIERPNEHDVFVHHTNIRMDGHRTLLQNQEVEFVIIDGEKGAEAQEVEVVG